MAVIHGIPVIPAKAGTQGFLYSDFRTDALGPRLRGMTGGTPCDA
jgi:hypothetical protein